MFCVLTLDDIYIKRLPSSKCEKTFENMVMIQMYYVINQHLNIGGITNKLQDMG